MASIKAISYYLPNGTLTNQDINEQFPDWTVEKIASKVGIQQRHIAAADEFSSDLAFKAAEQLFSEHNIDRSSIDFLLLCTQSPDYFLPTTACILQERLQLPTTVGALDFNLGCSGFVYGLSLAKGLIEGGMAKNVLLITAETYSKFIHKSDKSNRTIFGDAAAATLVTEETGICSIDNFVFGTDGRGANNLIVKEGGLKHPAKRESSDTLDDSNLFMDGAEIFNFTLESVPNLVNAVLQKAKLVVDDIGLFVFHQANQYMLNHLRKKIGIAEECFFISMKNCGNTVSSTIPIALSEANKQGKLTKDSNVLLAGFGVGYSWAGCVLTIN